MSPIPIPDEPEAGDVFASTLHAETATEVTHPPVEEMTAAERAHLGIGDPS